jgi:hypothetical protein
MSIHMQVMDMHIVPSRLVRFDRFGCCSCASSFPIARFPVNGSISLHSLCYPTVYPVCVVVLT